METEGFTWIELPVNKQLLSNAPSVKAAKVPGGWLIWASSNNKGGLTFYPDPKHEWDGGTLP